MKRWLKGGLWGLFIAFLYFLLSGLFTLISIKSGDFTNFRSVSLIFLSIFLITFAVAIMLMRGPYLFSGNTLFKGPDWVLNTKVLYSSLLISLGLLLISGFIIGAIIGLIVGKIKSKKEVEIKEKI